MIIFGNFSKDIDSYYAKEEKDCYLKLDLFPTLAWQDIAKITSFDGLYGVLPPKAIEFFSNKNLENIKKEIKAMRLDIKEPYEAKYAQVISGGIELSQLNDNLSVKKNNKIYCIGESLDIDGICGGYNLLFAFASAILVAKEIIKHENSN